MHSSALRSSDFNIQINGRTPSLSESFDTFRLSDRIGIVTDKPLDGLGAATLILSGVTAFYDCYREISSDFFAYPDFYNLQVSKPLTQYGMFDIWPDHKSSMLPGDPNGRLGSIGNRAITILVVPEGDADVWSPPDDGVTRAVLESVRRCVRMCLVYSPEGRVDQQEIVINCSKVDIESWGTQIIDGSGWDQANSATKRWRDACVGGNIEQSFRHVDLSTALSILMSL
ncbi:hypothetical protein MK139_02940 [bacterium]|nr:hypothetical protein [bacterium]